MISRALSDLLDGQIGILLGDCHAGPQAGLAFVQSRPEVDRKRDGEARTRLPAAILAGTTGEIVERLGNLSEAGVKRVMLQWLEVDDIDSLEAMAHAVLPQVTAG